VDKHEDTKSLEGPAWKEAEAYGFDMSIVEANLRRTPLERIRVHNRALRTAHLLREAMERYRQASLTPSDRAQPGPYHQGWTTMTRREYVEAATEHREADRVPCAIDPREAFVVPASAGSLSSASKPKETG